MQPFLSTAEQKQACVDRQAPDETYFDHPSLRPRHELRHAFGAQRVGNVAEAGKMSDRILAQIPLGLLPQALMDALQAEKAIPKTIIMTGDALLSAGRPDLAAIVFRELADRRKGGSVPWTRLAKIAGDQGETDVCIELWRECFRRFPGEAQWGWYMSLAVVLRSAGRVDEERHVVDEYAAKFPNDARGFAAQAQFAKRRGDWPAACDRWSECLERAGQSARPDWLNEYARALFQVWRLGEALEVWGETLRLFPDFLRAYYHFATAQFTLGHLAEARQLWDAAIRHSPADEDPGAHYQRARCIVGIPSTTSEHDIIADLQRRFPGSPLGWHLAIEVSNTRQWGHEATLASMADGFARFPNDRTIAAKYVQCLLGCGQYDEAEALVERLEAEAQDHWALICRWHLIMDLEGIDEIESRVAEAIRTLDWENTPCGEVCKFLTLLRSEWSLRLSLQLCENVLRGRPLNLGLPCLKAELLVKLGRDEDALAIIDTLPELYEAPTVLELRAWAAAYRGRKAEGGTILPRIWRPRFNSALHAPEPNLELISRAQNPTSGVILFAIVRDEMKHLPDFLDHHRRLGIRHFIVVDNMSRDGSDAWLRAQPDITLYRTADSFPAASSGMRWMNALMDLYGQDKWCLHADADERFIYPACETVPIDRLIHYLQSEGADSVCGYMLDIYPERLIDADGRPAGLADCKFYDDNIFWLGDTLPPYRLPVGGVRHRLFSVYETLHKVPLVRGDVVRYLGSHNATISRPSDVSSLLLHYKSIDLFEMVGQRIPSDAGRKVVSDRVASTFRRYQRYAQRLDEVAHTDLRVEGVTRELADSLVLTDRGLINAPPAYRRWLQSAKRHAFSQQRSDFEHGEYPPSQNPRRSTAPITCSG